MHKETRGRGRKGKFFYSALAAVQRAAFLSIGQLIGALSRDLVRLLNCQITTSIESSVGFRGLPQQESEARVKLAPYPPVL